MELREQEDKYECSKIVCLPFINAPPNDYSTVCTSILTAIEELFSKVIVRLGGFHLLMSANSVDKILSGYAYARAVRALAYAALGGLIFEVLGLTEEELFALDTVIDSFHQFNIDFRHPALHEYIGTQVFSFVILLAGSAVLLDNSARDSHFQPRVRESMRLLIMNAQYEPAKNTLAMIQEGIACCGADGPDDYLNLQQPLPTECRDTVTGNPFFHGCVDELTWFFEAKCAWIAALAMLTAFVSAVTETHEKKEDLDLGTETQEKPQDIGETGNFEDNDGELEEVEVHEVFNVDEDGYLGKED
ncbi:unnamed protein product [Ceutorhynchus assimilis]|uniref:Uncharacterized protein n=1 Tax=Ceutorhynchus assimilis TaxID=467358 RepID=A0A9N9MHQ2_9CUCU|nr:unnamed protein product [Ceutorhynchus assimilis]